MRGILKAVAGAAQYPESSAAPALDLSDRSARALAAAEAEAAAAERRAELFVLARNAAKVFPEEGVAVAGPRLQALVSEPDTGFQACFTCPSPCWALCCLGPHPAVLVHSLQKEAQPGA